MWSKTILALLGTCSVPSRKNLNYLKYQDNYNYVVLISNEEKNEDKIYPMICIHIITICPTFVSTLRCTKNRCHTHAQYKQ